MMRFYLQLAFILFLSIQLLGQTVERSKLLTAYTYSFAKNIEWPAAKNEYTIHVITTDSELINEFRSLGQTRRLKEKPMRISVGNSPIVPSGMDIVVVGKGFNQATRTILNQVKGNPILTITDGFDDNRFIMINFVQTDPQTLSFEINRANIINQGLRILPDMVLLGGDEIDVARLYREAQDSLISMERKILAMKNRFDSLSMNVASSRRLVERQQELLGVQTREIEEKQIFAQQQQKLLDSLTSEFNRSGGQLDSLVGYLNTVREELAQVENELQKQQESVMKGDEILEAQSLLMDQRDKEIMNRESELQEMETVVISQKNTMLFLFIFSAILILFSYVTYRAYTSSRKAAVKLAEQKEELSNLLSELRDAQSQLVQSEKMASLGVLIAGIAHEINNAINFVYSGIHIIKAKFGELSPVIRIVKNLKVSDKNLVEKVRKIEELKDELQYTESQNLIVSMIKNVQVGAERTTEIVKGLRTFSKSETDERTMVDVHQDIEISLLLLESKHKNRITIDKKYAENIPEIEGYQGQLGQAFMNLIGNAIDALDEKGGKNPKITIRTKKKKNSVEISIKDNGPGIDEEVIDKIFDPFFTTKGIGTGTGLGLSITYGIVEKHQGTIQVNTQSGKSTEFVIDLPIEHIS